MIAPRCRKGLTMLTTRSRKVDKAAETLQAALVALQIAYVLRHCELHHSLSGVGVSGTSSNFFFYNIN